MPKTLSRKPRRASVVFVVDGSRSFDEHRIAAAVEVSRAYASHLQDAQYEYVVFRRKAERLFSRFVPFAKLETFLAKSEEKLAPGNGSHVERALALAAEMLRGRRGPKRIVVITDAHYREAYENRLADQALRPLKDGVVHFVSLFPAAADADPEEVGLFREDDHLLAPVPLGHGGVFYELQGGTVMGDYKDAVLELVRPLRIDRFEIVDPDAVFSDEIAPPASLKEGESLRFMELADGSPRLVKLRGAIWAEPFVRVVGPDTDFGRSTVPALLFATALYEDLDERQMMRAAVAGRVVSPVTSYLAIEPGTRPSRDGFEEGGFGRGSGGLGGRRGAGFLRGDNVRAPDFEAMLRRQAEAAAAPCRGDNGPADGIPVRIETTLHEIVDVEVSLEEAATRECVVEALWGISLPPVFKARWSLNVDLELFKEE